jgi:hypothetical protein
LPFVRVVAPSTPQAPSYKTPIAREIGQIDRPHERVA